MPTTYNGIGTHYYGRKNIQKRTAPCHSCGRTVELTSYDTRLWFVIFFVPIFPVGRKRILDYCPACSRHYAVEADKWETARQLEVSGAQDKFRTEPTAENAIAVHQQLLHFHQLDQAAEFQRTMTAKFGDNAKVHAYLGAALAHLGKLDEAAPCYARALELRPDLPEARAGVALARIRTGKLEEARALLDFLEKPGASKLYSLEPLDQLARAYQTANRHDDALSVFAALLKELPKLGEEKWFRTLVARSEKGEGHRESLLPKLKFSWKRFFTVSRGPQPAAGPRVTWRGLAILGILLGVVALSFVISNEYIRRHRMLHIVSGFKEPALVEVRGVGTVRTSRNAVELPLKEGRYHAVISGPVKQELDFEIKAGYWSRWFDDPVWVLNVGGSALLEMQFATYAKDPPPVAYSFHFGQPFEHFTRVTHPFRELPGTVQLKSGERRELIGLDLFRREPAAIFYYFEQKRNLPEALRLAEWRLRMQPDDEAMLGMYVSAAQANRQLDRAEKFLVAGLTNRPIVIQWHRLYQNLHRDHAHQAQLAVEYDRQIKTEFTNSALLYLRGRVSEERADSREWFQRACEADAKNAFPVFALGFDHASVANWAAARPLFARACALRPQQPEFAEALANTRLALGEFAALEQELRAQLAGEEFNYAAARRLCDVLVAQGRNADAAAEVRKFQSRAMAHSRETTREPNLELTRHLLYVTGDFDKLAQISATDSSPEGKFAYFTALLELGRPAEAAVILSLESDTVNNPFVFLNAAIACRLAGDAAAAGRWQTRAVALMNANSGDLMRAASALSKPTPPSHDELDEIAIGTELKASVLTALAQMHPDHRAEFAKLARALNVNLAFPHHLLERGTAEKP